MMRKLKPAYDTAFKQAENNTGAVLLARVAPPVYAR